MVSGTMKLLSLISVEGFKLKRANQAKAYLISPTNSLTFPETEKYREVKQVLRANFTTFLQFKSETGKKSNNFCWETGEMPRN